jgi:hypothetical protein
MWFRTVALVGLLALVQGKITDVEIKNDDRNIILIARPFGYAPNVPPSNRSLVSVPTHAPCSLRRVATHALSRNTLFTHAGSRTRASSRCICAVTRCSCRRTRRRSSRTRNPS